MLHFLQVRQLQEDAVRLQSAYAGDKADDIQKREGEVSPLCFIKTLMHSYIFLFFPPHKITVKTFPSFINLDTASKSVEP